MAVAKIPFPREFSVEKSPVLRPLYNTLAALGNAGANNEGYRFSYNSYFRGSRDAPEMVIRCEFATPEGRVRDLRDRFSITVSRDAYWPRLEAPPFVFGIDGSSLSSRDPEEIIEDFIKGWAMRAMPPVATRMLQQGRGKLSRG